MKFAVFVRDIETDNPRVSQKLYKISPPEVLNGEMFEYVVVSAADVPPMMESMPYTRVHETFIFAADADGEWLSSRELAGSTRGVVDHTFALNSGGYMVVPSISDDVE